LNAAGLAYVATKYSANVAFCLREYDHDVLDSPPASGQNFRNGMYFSSIGWSAYQKAPRLILTYMKVPNWVQHFGPSDWSITNGATWDGLKYISVAGAVELAPVGTWFDDERPIKIRVTFSGDANNKAWIEAQNTDGFGDLFGNQAVEISSLDELYIDNYGNFDLAALDIFLDTGATVTNIEFLYP
jgi:hypothetical protein